MSTLGDAGRKSGPAQRPARPPRAEFRPTPPPCGGHRSSAVAPIWKDCVKPLTTPPVRSSIEACLDELPMWTPPATVVWHGHCHMAQRQGPVPCATQCLLSWRTQQQAATPGSRHSSTASCLSSNQRTTQGDLRSPQLRRRRGMASPGRAHARRRFHYCRSRDFTTRRAPTPPDTSYIPDASGPDTLYDTVRRVVQCTTQYDASYSVTQCSQVVSHLSANWA